MFKHIQPWARPAVMAFLIIAATMILAYIASALWGAKDVREWIGAFSGWAAAIAAVTIGIRTIDRQDQQIRLPGIEKEITALETKIDLLVRVREMLDEQHGDPAFWKAVKHNSIEDKLQLMQSRYLKTVQSLHKKLNPTKRIYPLGDTGRMRSEIRENLHEIRDKIEKQATIDFKDLLDADLIILNTIDAKFLAEERKFRERLEDLTNEQMRILKAQH